MKPTECLKILFMTGILLLSTMVWVNPVSAHISPESCTGSGLGIGLYVNPPVEVKIGESVFYRVNVYNVSAGGPTVCDVSDINVLLTTPDGIVHPILLRSTTLTNGQNDAYVDVISYVARVQDITSGNILRATASVTGVIHQNDTNSLGGANQGVNLTVMTTPPVVVVSPSPSPTPSPTPTLTPSPSPTPSPTQSPISQGGGSTYRLVSTSTSTPSPTPTPTPTTAPVVAPKLPNTGLGPNEKSIPGSIIIPASIFAVSIFFYLVRRKQTI